MINKIKDFLSKKLGRKTSDDLSDQDELLDDDSFQSDRTNPGIQPAVENSSPDKTGSFNVQAHNIQLDHSLNDEDESFPEVKTKSNLKSKLGGGLNGILSSIKNIKLNKQFLNSLSIKGDGATLLSPNLNKAIEKTLSRSSRETIHQISLICLICSVTYFVGKMSALIAKGPPTLDQAKDYSVSISLEKDFNPGTLAQVKGINIFRTNTGLGTKKTIVADKKCDEAQQRSNLPIKLINTVVLQDTVKSLASVQIRGEKDLQEVRVGDQISNMAKIFKITRLELLVKNLDSGTCESISSDLKNNEQSSPISVMNPAQSREYRANKKMSGIENNGNKFAISKTLLDEKLKDIAAVLTQAKAVKIQNPDGSLSFKMTELDPQGIFPYLGIQDQDIITSINGKPIYDMNEVMLLFGRIKGLENLSLGIKREGSDSVQEYAIKK